MAAAVTPEGLVADELSDSATTPRWRRPETTDPDDFFYVSAEKWAELLDALRQSNERKSRRKAIRNLQRYDQVGRIMETEEGTMSLYRCIRCFNAGIICRVFANRPDKTCAYCKRHGLSACEATFGVANDGTQETNPLNDAGDTYADTITPSKRRINMERRVKVLEERAQEHKNDLDETMAKITSHQQDICALRQQAGAEETYLQQIVNELREAEALVAHLAEKVHALENFYKPLSTAIPPPKITQVLRFRPLDDGHLKRVDASTPDGLANNPAVLLEAVESPRGMETTRQGHS